MNHPTLPFIAVAALVFAMGNGVGDPLDIPAANTGNQSTGHQTTHQQPTRAYNNGYTDSGHQNTLIGDMVHQMRHEGAIRPSTLSSADDMLARCAKLKPPRPPVCD